MARPWICVASAAAAVLISSPVLGEPLPASPASASINSRANELFDRDSTLRQWAVRIYDANHDGWLTLYEAQAALAAFRDIADGDLDGRVTPFEYARAKEFVAARW